MALQQAGYIPRYIRGITLVTPGIARVIANLHTGMNHGEIRNVLLERCLTRPRVGSSTWLTIVSKVSKSMM